MQKKFLLLGFCNCSARMRAAILRYKNKTQFAIALLFCFHFEKRRNMAETNFDNTVVSDSAGKRNRRSDSEQFTIIKKIRSDVEAVMLQQNEALKEQMQEEHTTIQNSGANLFADEDAFFASPTPEIESKKIQLAYAILQKLINERKAALPLIEKFKSCLATYVVYFNHLYSANKKDKNALSFSGLLKSEEDIEKCLQFFDEDKTFCVDNVKYHAKDFTNEIWLQLGDGLDKFIGDGLTLVYDFSPYLKEPQKVMIERLKNISFSLGKKNGRYAESKNTANTNVALFLNGSLNARGKPISPFFGMFVSTTFKESKFRNFEILDNGCSSMLNEKLHPIALELLAHHENMNLRVHADDNEEHATMDETNYIFNFSVISLLSKAASFTLRLENGCLTPYAKDWVESKCSYFVGKTLYLKPQKVSKDGEIVGLRRYVGASFFSLAQIVIDL